MMSFSEQRTAVYLNIYDFTPLNSCLRMLRIPAYHCGIEINNLQYCFCVIDSNPTISGLIIIQPQSAQYQFNRKLYLGSTTATQAQIQEMIEELQKKYICGSYHMFKCNCNHFCDEFSRILLGRPIPQEIFTITNFLKYFCCCLPKGLVTGLWAIQAMEDQMGKEDQYLLRDIRQ